MTFLVDLTVYTHTIFVYNPKGENGSGVSLFGAGMQESST